MARESPVALQLVFALHMHVNCVAGAHVFATRAGICLLSCVGGSPAGFRSGFGLGCTTFPSGCFYWCCVQVAVVLHGAKCLLCCVGGSPAGFNPCFGLGCTAFALCVSCSSGGVSVVRLPQTPPAQSRGCLLVKRLRGSPEFHIACTNPGFCVLGSSRRKVSCPLIFARLKLPQSGASPRTKISQK